MEKYINFIRSIKPLDYDKYKDVSSREKLAVYTMFFLENNKIPLIFNFICVAIYKLFPKKFYFGDFEEYPHIEMLNRTILHLRPKERNYAQGDVRKGYILTELGSETALNVDRQLKGEISFSVSKNNDTVIDRVKNTPSKNLKNIELAELYKIWERNKKIENSEIWKFFEVTPFTRIPYIKTKLKDLKSFAQDGKNNKIYNFLIELEKHFNNLTSKL